MPYNYEWANRYLSEYHSDLTEYINRTTADEPREGELSLLHSSLIANQGPIRTIIEDVLGVPAPRFGEPFKESANYELHQLLAEALVIIRKKAEMDEHWSPDTVIDVDTDALHSWVWHAAEDLWASGHLGQAVEAAMKVINVKCRRRSSGATSPRSILSTKPGRLPHRRRVRLVSESATPVTRRPTRA